MLEEVDFSTANLNSLMQVTFLKLETVICDRYVIKRVLGSGGMGTVYLAIDLGLPGGRPCAIKETPSAADEHPTSQQTAQINGLHQEADIMSKLNHHAIPRIFNFFPWERRHYLVMEHIEGETLNDLLSRQITQKGVGFDEFDVLSWAIKICELFTYLHTRDKPIIYRDCKPDNLIITPNNEMKMIDFGIARRLLYDEMKMTQYGTKGYAAPEAYTGRGDPRSDIYSLGALMHALLTNVEPRNIEFFDWSNHRPRSYRPTLSQGIDQAIMRCLQEDPANRWDSAQQLREVLSALYHQAHRSRRGASKQHDSAPLRTNGNTTGHNISGSLDIPVSIDLRLPGFTGQTKFNNAYSEGVIHPPLSALAPDVAWVAEMNAPLRSSPVIRDNTVYFGAHDAHIYALDVETGERKGAFAVNGVICSDPIVTERSVIFGSEDGHIYAVDRALNRKQWSYNTGKSIVSSPAVLNDMAIFGSDNMNVYALPLVGNEPRWKFQTWGPIRGSLASLGGLVIFGSHDHRIYAVDPQGNRKWVCTTNDKVDAAPILHNNIIIMGSLDRHIYAVEVETGMQIWRRVMDECITTAAAAFEQRLYVGTADGRITCLDFRTGVVKWRYDAGSQISSDLVLQDGRLYFGCGNGAFYCLDVRRQEPVWRHMAFDSIVTRPAIIGDLVIVGSVDGCVYALRTRLGDAE